MGAGIGLYLGAIDGPRLPNFTKTRFSDINWQGLYEQAGQWRFRCSWTKRGQGIVIGIAGRQDR